MKFCKKCRVETERYKGGRCKPCTNARAKIYRAENRDVIKAASAAWYRAHLERARVTNANWKKDNPEKRKAICAAYRAANSEKCNDRVKAWQESNPDRVKANNSAWSRGNRPKRNSHGAKYRAAKLRRTPAWLTSEQQDEIAAFYLSATTLGKEVDHIVPLQGKTVSGLHVPWNLQLLTTAENASKSNTQWPDMP